MTVLLILLEPALTESCSELLVGRARRDVDDPVDVLREPRRRSG
jgi:hypothetical protein